MKPLTLTKKNYNRGTALEWSTEKTTRWFVIVALPGLFSIFFPMESLNMQMDMSSFYHRPMFQTITKTRLYNFDPLKPHFYIVKLEFTGVYTIFLTLVKTIDCRYSFEPPRRGGSNDY